MTRIRIGGTLALASGALFILLACSLSGVPLISKAEATAAPHPTRTSRPTFTPRPADTDTPVPTDTVEPTEAPPPTEAAPTAKPKAPTAKPKPKATQPPAPPPPPQNTQPPQATKSPFTYSFVNWSPCTQGDTDICNIQGGVHCEHSGGHELRAVVYANIRDPNSQLAGVKVRFSNSPGGGPIDPDEETGPEGVAAKTLSTVTDAPGKNIGTYYAWVVTNTGAQNSEFSAPIPINDKKDGDPATCWVGTVAFAGGK